MPRLKYPWQRIDFIDAIEWLATGTPTGGPTSEDAGWFDLTNVVHALVDDTWWDERH